MSDDEKREQEIERLDGEVQRLGGLIDTATTEAEKLSAQRDYNAVLYERAMLYGSREEAEYLGQLATVRADALETERLNERADEEVRRLTGELQVAAMLREERFSIVAKERDEARAQLATARDAALGEALSQLAEVAQKWGNSSPSGPVIGELERRLRALMEKGR